MTEGVECVVEMADGNKGVVVTTRSREDRRECCVGIFNKVVSCVMEVKASLCHSVGPSFFLLDSTEEADYLNPDHQFSMSHVERALTCPQESYVIISVSGRRMMERTRLLCMRKLTHWESLFPIDFDNVVYCLKDMVKELFDLGRSLGVSVGELKSIEEDFPCNTSRRRRELVRVWLSSSMDPHAGGTLCRP